MDFHKLTQKQIASAVGTSDRTVRTWQKEGMPRNEDGSYDLPKVVEWMLNEAREDAASIAGGECTPGGQDALSLYRYERYLIAKLQREREEGKTWYEDEIADQWALRMAAVSSGLDMLPYQVAPHLEMRDQADIVKILSEKIWTLKDNFCRSGKFCLPQEGSENG